MHQTLLLQDRSETASQDQEYECPSLLCHLLRSALFQHEKTHTLKTLVFLKRGDVFSPAGVICDVWHKVTNKAWWVDDNYNYATPSSGRAFCSSSAPYNIIKEFCTKNTTDLDKCPISQFLLTEVNNDVDEYLAAFSKMKAFKVKTPDLPPLTNFPPPVTIPVWRIIGNKIEHNVIVSSEIHYAQAPTILAAKAQFRTQHPELTFESVTFVNNSAPYTNIPKETTF